MRKINEQVSHLSPYILFLQDQSLLKWRCQLLLILLKCQVSYFGTNIKYVTDLLISTKRIVHGKGQSV